MRIASPLLGPARPRETGPALLLPGRPWRPAQVISVASWCWLAAADGRFDRAAIRSDGNCTSIRLSRCR